MGNGVPNAEGPIAEMLIRVRAKEAKRKAQHESEDQETVKKRCQRKERMAIVQLKAYWDCFPLPAMEDQLRTKRDAESSEDELIEDDGQGHIGILKTGPSKDSEVEIINADAFPDRKRYLDELRKCINAKGQPAHDKRRKLDQTNSRGQSKCNQPEC